MALHKLETPRLIMRSWTVHDIDDMHQLWTNADVRKYLWDDETIARERAAETVFASIECAEACGVGMWTLLDRATKSVAGFCGFRYIENSDDVEILYAIYPAFWRQGLAREAAQASIDYGFRTCLFDCVYGRTDPPNTASVRLLESLGMQFKSETLIGELPALVYSLEK